MASLALQMRPIGGKTEGTLGLGDRVVFAGWRFGLPHLREIAITRYERPNFFQDSTRRGRLTRYQFDHQFVEIDGQTLIVDKLRFSVPFGWLGKKISKRLVVPAVAALVRRRLELLKQICENGQWRIYLSEPAETPREHPSRDTAIAEAS